MTDKLSQAILLLRQATDIQLEAHKLMSEFYDLLSGKDGGGPTTQGPEVPGPVVSKPSVPANPPAVSDNPPPAGGNSFQDWLSSPEGRERFRKALASARATTDSKTVVVPLHEDGTPLSVGDVVDRGGRVFRYAGPCKDCGNPSYATGTGSLRYPAGAYRCWDCYKAANR